MPAVIRTGREAVLLPPTSDERKNEWSYTCTPPNMLYGVHKGKLYHTTSAHCLPADSNGLNYAYVGEKLATACSPFRLDKTEFE